MCMKLGSNNHNFSKRNQIKNEGDKSTCENKKWTKFFFT